MYVIILIIFVMHNHVSGGKRHNLPPSPAAALPVIGHLHRTFQCFSQISGSIFSLKLGVRRCVVVSSPELVEECFTKNDIALSNRPHNLADEYIAYNQLSVLGAPYGEYWRSLRRIAAQELLSAARLKSFLQIRKEEIDRLVLSIHKESGEGPKLSELTFNVMTRMVAGERCLNKNENFLEVIKEVFEIGQTSNPQDFGGFTKKLVSLSKEMDGFFQGLIDEHRDRVKQSNTMIGNLLFLQESQPQFCSDLTIKAHALIMILAGMDTSSVSIEWAMSLVLNHPQVLKKARAELETQVGHHRLVNEDDLPNLPYLGNIILETFRLFPAAPLLIPHAASFKPERFEGKQAEPYKLMPFGAGRRACPGSGLVQRVVGVALGSVIQCFDWERVSPDKVDLAEGVGLTMPKLVALEALCKSREIMNNIF